LLLNFIDILFKPVTSP